MSYFKIALSAGHGKNTAGKRCMKKLDGNETREWTLNSRIAEKVEDLLLGYTGWELLRLDDRTGAQDVPLKTRSKAANNWGADFYLAIHHNAGVNGGKGGGIVAYVYKKPTSEELAWQKELYTALIDHTGLSGNRSTPMGKANFHEVREPDAASVLLELGFMDSKTDVPVILTEEYADQCAAAIVEVLARKGGLAKITEPQEPEQDETPVTEETPVTGEDSNVPTKVDAAKSFSASKAGTYVVKSSDGTLNLRAGADSGKALIETLKNGDKVKCYGYYTGKWLYVISEAGNKGFCHAGYLSKE